MGYSKIEWLKNADGSKGRVWNPITGCTRVSAGCDHCYAHAMHARFGKGPFTPTFHPERLDEPLHWRKPSRVFVCSMGDLFHEDVTDEQITDVFHVMVSAPQHVFMLLTKRPERMREWINGAYTRIWLGVSVENQATADERIPILLQTPAAVRFVSCEPLLAPVDLQIPYGQGVGDLALESGKLHWVIVGVESGPGARLCDPSWVRSIIGQCKTAGIPLFVKQWRDPMNGKLVKMPRIDGKVFD